MKRALLFVCLSSSVALAQSTTEVVTATEGVTAQGPKALKAAVRGTPAADGASPKGSFGGSDTRDPQAGPWTAIQGSFENTCSTSGQPQAGSAVETSFVGGESGS
jgi:hypothetical protein